LTEQKEKYKNLDEALSIKMVKRLSFLKSLSYVIDKMAVKYRFANASISFDNYY